MSQQKKKILHKLCIDMERSEYTSFSMLAILKCEFQWTLFDQYDFAITAVFVQ